MGKYKVPRKYIDAYYKDVERLWAKYEQLEGKKDAKSKAELKKLKPFMTKESLAKRKEQALKLDGADMDKIVNTFVFD